MILSQSQLARLWKKYKQFDSGTISACRGESENEGNAERMEQLHAFLVAKGFSVTALDGVFIEGMGTPAEKSVRQKFFLVFDRNATGTLKETLMKLGEKFGQDLITFNDASTGSYHLIGTAKREGAAPGYHESIKLGEPMFDEEGKLLLSIKGRPFVFSEGTPLDDEHHGYDDTILKYNVSRIRGMVLYAREYFE